MVRSIAGHAVRVPGSAPTRGEDRANRPADRGRAGAVTKVEYRISNVEMGNDKVIGLGRPFDIRYWMFGIGYSLGISRP